MRSYIYFNNLNSYFDLDLAIVNVSNFPTITEDIEEEEVDGRNGKLTIKKGTYKDIKFQIEFRLKNRKTKSLDVWEKLDMIEEWFSNIENNMLYFSFRPNRCFKVKVAKMSDKTRKFNHFGNFEVDFICEPFMYDPYESIMTLDKFTNLKYSGSIEGECYMKIYGTGNIQLTINNETIQINNVNEYVELDSKLLECRNPDGSSKSIDMIGYFPILIKGTNNISWEGNVSKIDLLPRTAYK